LRLPHVVFSEMLRLSSWARLDIIVIRNSVFPLILIQYNDAPPIPD